MSLLGEIKRRKVFQVAAVYAVVAWLLVQIVDVVNEPLSLPDWFDTAVIMALAIGFPIAVILAWAFDLTPEGVVKDQGTDPNGGRRIEYVLIGLLVVSVGWLAYRVEIIPPQPFVEVVTEEAIANLSRDRHSIAVLPFANESAAEENAEFLANGLHDDILTQLAKINSLSVISRTSVLAYRDTLKLMSEIGEELGATSIVEGRVQRAGNMVRINVQLIDAATDIHIWGEIYNSELTTDNIFEIQANVATSIAAALEAELSPAELESIERVSTDSTEALALYWRARELVPNIRSTPPVEFHEYLDEAIELDPDFALAYALKATDYAFSMIRPDATGSILSREALARGYAEIALDLDPQIGFAHFALGSIHRFRWRGAEALAEHQRALELSPNDFDILDDFARVSSALGRHEEAIALARRAGDLGQATYLLAMNLWRAGRHDESAGMLREARGSGPGFGISVQLALIELSRGNDAAARAELARGEEGLAGGYGEFGLVNLSNMIYAQGRLGNAEAASRYFSEFDARAPSDIYSVGYWAIAYLGAGDEAQALRWMTVLADENDVWVGSAVLLADNTLGDPVLDQPEFVEVRDRIGFTDF